ncbi:MAG: hypothetical protein Q9190_000886 [Brigantiaea leucoxantha]
MASDIESAPSISTLLASLTTSLNSASHSLPPIIDNLSHQEASTGDGLSLLDTKNELLLSYLQNLVFWILVKIKGPSAPSPPSSSIPTQHPSSQQEDIAKQLITLRTYLEKGVKPLEAKLKYQIQKLVDAADEADAHVSRNVESQKPDGGSNDEEDDEEMREEGRNEDLVYRPDPTALVLPGVMRGEEKEVGARRKEGVYKPPRFTPVVPPTTAATSSVEKRERERKQRSHLLDRYVAEELSGGPVTELSVGAGSGLKGREAERERERRDYEESRLVRLPSEGGKRGGKRVRMRGEDLDMGDGMEDLKGVDVRALAKAGRGKRRREGGEIGREIGENWEKRKKRGVRGLGKKR